MSMPVDQIAKLVEAIAKASGALAAIFEDKRVSLRDLKHLPSILRAARLAAGIDFKQVLPEVKDLDDEELKVLEKAFKDYFDLSDDSMENMIEQGFEYLLMAIQAVMAFMDFDTKVKKAG